MKYRTIGTTAPRKVSVLSLGAMLFGTATDEATSFAILDRYVEAGGTFIDTADNYAFWFDNSQGGHSERLLGKWRRSRGVGDELTIATKLAGRPTKVWPRWTSSSRRSSAPNWTRRARQGHALDACCTGSRGQGRSARHLTTATTSA